MNSLQPVIDIQRPPLYHYSRNIVTKIRSSDAGDASVCGYCKPAQNSSGDDATDNIVDLRAALTNALNRLAKIEERQNHQSNSLAGYAR